MDFAADGAQDPFSTKPTVRSRKPLDFSRIKNWAMGGNTPAS